MRPPHSNQNNIQNSAKRCTRGTKHLQNITQIQNCGTTHLPFGNHRCNSGTKYLPYSNHPNHLKNPRHQISPKQHPKQPPLIDSTVASTSLRKQHPHNTPAKEPTMAPSLSNGKCDHASLFVGKNNRWKQMQPPKLQPSFGHGHGFGFRCLVFACSFYLPFAWLLMWHITSEKCVPNFVAILWLETFENYSPCVWFSLDRLLEKGRRPYTAIARGSKTIQ